MRIRPIVLLCSIVLVAAACGGTSTSDPSVPAQASAAGDPGLGEPLYQNNCAQCHGADLRGTDQGPPHLDEVYEPDHHADISFVLAVQRGVQQHHWNFGPMPAIEGLDEEEIGHIVAYVREQQRAVGID